MRAISIFDHHPIYRGMRTCAGVALALILLTLVWTPAAASAAPQHVRSGEICTFEPVFPCPNGTYHWSASAGYPISSEAMIFEWTAPDVGSLETITVNLTITNEDGCEGEDGVELIVEPFNPNINITKSVDPNPVYSGQEVTYTYLVENTGDVNLTDITVTDDQGLVPVIVGGNDDDGVLGPGEVWIYQATARPVFSVSNVGTVTAKDPIGGTVSDYSVVAVVVEILIPSIGIEKDCIYEMPVRVGDIVTYTYNITNTGDLPLTDVNVSDDQEIGPSCNPVYASGDLERDNVLEPGESWMYECVYEVPNPVDYGPLVVMSDGSGSVNMVMLIQKLSRMKTRLGIKLNKLIELRESFNVSTARLVVTHEIIDEKSYTFYNYTDPVTDETLDLMMDEYGIMIRSEYYDPITDAVLTTEYDPKGEVVSDTYLCKRTMEYLRIEYEKPKVGQRTYYTVIDYRTGDTLISVIDVSGVVVSMEYRKTPGYIPRPKIFWLSNIATVTAADPNDNTVTDWDIYSLEVAMPEPEFNVSKSADSDPAKAGGLISYTISYDNRGRGVAHGVVIVETYDDNVTFKHSNPMPDMGTDDRWSIGDLMPGGSGKITVTVEVSPDAPRGTVLKNTVNMTCEEDINASVVIGTGVAGPELEITKTGSPDPVTAGKILNYTITYGNIGDGEAHEVVINETYDKNVIFNRSNPDPDNGTNNRWTIGNLSIYETGKVIIAVEVLPNTTNGTIIKNKATITCNEGARDEVTINTTVGVPLQIDLWINKTADKSVYSAGNKVRYIIHYGNGNESAQNLTDVKIMDILPDVEYVSATPPPNRIDGNVLVWNIGNLNINTSGSIKLVVKIPKKQDLMFEETSSVTGEGFILINNRLTTSRKPYGLTNYVNITGWGCVDANKTTKNASATITVKTPGTTIRTVEHGSGYYEGDRLLGVSTANRSVRLDKDTFAQHRETTFSLPGKREIDYDSLWSDRTCAKNHARGESVSESYLYMDNIDKESSFLVDVSQTTYASCAEFSGGLVRIGYLKRDPKSGETLIELHEDYHGSFRTEESLDSYGSGVALSKYAKGTGFVAVDKKIGNHQRSFEHGSGYYESEELIQTGTVYKDSLMDYIPTAQRAGGMETNYSSKWYEGMTTKGKESVICERIGSADYIEKETVMDSATMTLVGEFQGGAEITVVEKTGSTENEKIRVDQTLRGRYNITTSIGIYGIPTYLTPHVNVTKEAIMLDEDRVLFIINVTNDGNKALGPVYLTDTLPEGLTFINSSLRPEIEGPRLVWTFPSLPIGGLQTVELQTVLEGTGAGTGTGMLVNLVNVTAEYGRGSVTAEASSEVVTDWLSFSAGPIPAREEEEEEEEEEAGEVDEAVAGAVLPLPAPEDKPEDLVLVNLMIDADLYPYAPEATPEEMVDLEANSLLDMINEIGPKKLNVTIYTTGDFISQRTGGALYKLFVTQVGSDPRHELAMHGMTTDELLGSMPYGKQYPLLREAKRLVESAYVCEGLKIEAKGFRPQRFNQSETTYKILDKMDIVYDAGFQAGLVYLPGHEDDTWPYQAEGHSFYAVPVSTHTLSGEEVYLSDRLAKEELGLDGSQWYDLLVDEFEECATNDDPMVVVFHNFIFGSDEGYRDAYVDFIDYTTSKNAVFVTTLELVEIAKNDRVYSKLGRLEEPPDRREIVEAQPEEEPLDISTLYGSWDTPGWNLTVYEMDCNKEIEEYYKQMG
ncbi:MAG: hypothetical protein U9N48_05475 [Euryarchaeota archaeon]|nr:hypothetical protein [Euryarchaeota archaeon]